MAAIPLQQSFLPANVALGDIYLPEKNSYETPCKKVYGFDYTGKYFVIFTDERVYHLGDDDESSCFDPERFISATVLHYNEEKKGINDSTIKIRIKYPSKTVYHRFYNAMEYDSDSTNWFILDDFALKSNDEVGSGLTKEVTIYHGCLKPYLGTSKIIEIDDQSDANTVKLEYSNPTARATSRRLKLCNSRIFGPLLAVVLSRTGECILDLIQYNENEISHLKRLDLEQARINSSQNLYFNRAAEMFYLLNEYEYRDEKLEIIEYNFDGNQLSKYPLDSSASVDHIENNLFLKWNWETVQVFNITQTRVTTLWQFPVDANPKFDFRDVELIRGRGGVYFQKTNLPDFDEFDNSVDFITKLYDIYTGEKVFDQDKQKLVRFRDEGLSICGYNWHMGEVATVENATIVKIEKIETNIKMNLKHLARLACMKWLSAEYMSKRLPKCLHYLVGI
eukprot:TCONS_00006109-protein